MKRFILTTLILGAITAVGLLYFMGKGGDAQFQSFDYTPEDWVTTEYTLFSTDLSNHTYEKTFHATWEPLQKGQQLRPILRYRSNFVVVELPDGRRGVVNPATLAGVYRAKANNPESNFVKLMSAKQYRANNNKTAKGASWGEDPKNSEIPYYVTRQDGKENVTQAHRIWPSFADGMPEYYYDYNDKFKVYAAESTLETMTQAEIDSKYGQPISIAHLDNGSKKAFYSHLRTKEGYEREGAYIIYNADGTTTVELPRDNPENEYSASYIKKDYRPILSRISSVDWVDLPLAFPLVSIFHMNFVDITYTPTEEETKFPYLWIFIGSLIFSVAVLGFLIYLVITLCSPLKFLSNGVIVAIASLVTILPLLVIGTLYMELLQGLWIIIACITAFAAYMILGWSSSELQFNRCPFCRNVDCVSHTKTLIGKDVTTRVDTYDYDDTSIDYKWNGDRKSKTVIHKSDHDTMEVTTKKYRYDFHCSICDKDWDSIETESSERKIGSRTTSNGGTKTTYL